MGTLLRDTPTPHSESPLDCARVEKNLATTRVVEALGEPLLCCAVASKGPLVEIGGERLVGPSTPVDNLEADKTLVYGEDAGGEARQPP
jgi:hypothetical protein